MRGRDIWAEYWGPADASTKVVIIGQVHGDECAPSLLVEQVRLHPPDSYGIWLIPTLNPDGYAAYSRRNANGADLNADGGRRAQPETRALYDFVALVRPTLTIHLHSPNGYLGGSTFTASTAASLCQQIGAHTSMDCIDGGAGARAEHSRWFLWQGMAPLGGESLLIEFRAVSNAEVPAARPRPPTSTVAAVRAEAIRILTIMDATF